MKKKNVTSMILKKVTVSQLQLLKGKGNNATDDAYTNNPYQCIQSYNPNDCQISVDPRQDDVDD